MPPTLPKIALITSRAHLVLDSLERALNEALSALPSGEVLVIVREKEMPAPALLQLSRDLRRLAERSGNKLVVSGRFDLALAAGAHGVHLGGEAPPFEQLAAHLPREFLVGVSLHPGQALPQAVSSDGSPDESPDELRDGSSDQSSAESNDGSSAGPRMLPDYALYSPIFPSRLKPEVPPIGLSGLKAGCKQHHPLPLYALSGVSPDNAAECIRAGAYGVALLSGILCSPSPGREAERLWRALEGVVFKG